jgi:phosphatidylserine decarboxylase
MAGTVDRVVLSPGAFYAADKDKAELHNEYCALTITTSAGLQYTLWSRLAGLIARRIVCWAEQG